MDLDFTGDVWHWRGPAPFHFVSIPPEESQLVQEVAPGVSYGWGMVPCRARIGGTEWQTSLTPKDGRYALPLKDAVRTAEDIDVGDAVSVRLSIAV